MEGLSCPVCGAARPSNARGPIDPVTGLMLAGWWRRVGATVSDNLILLIPTLVVGSLFISLGGAVVGVIAALAVNGLYTVKFLSGARGQTIGNRVAASRVRDATSGRGLTVAQAFRRWAFIAVYTLVLLGPQPASQVVFYALLFADCLYPLVDARNRTLHDRFAGTIVAIA